MNLVDYLIIVVLLASIVLGAVRGFVREAVGLLSWLGGVWLAMKGRAPDDEAAALPMDVSVFHVEPLHVPGLDAQRCLVWLKPTKAG